MPVLWTLSLLGCDPAPPALAPVRVEAPAGIRDAWLVTPAGRGEPTVVWSRGDQRVDGPVLPASLRIPGERWTVDVRDTSGQLTLEHQVSPPPGGNVLIVVLDDVGANKVGVYGGDQAARTPRLDALAAQGVRFSHAFSAPLCSPSRAVLLTGRFGRRTGMGTITERESNGSELPLAALTLPEALAFARGPTYRTAAIGKWHLAGPEAPDWQTHPNRQGFERFVGSRGNPEYREGRGYDVWSRNVDGVVTDSTTYLTTATADDALAVIAALPEPWLVYVAFHAAHVPLHLPPAHLVPGGLPRGRDQDDLYDAMLASVDTEMGRLLDGIGEERLGRTTVFALGDNGTSRWGTDRSGEGGGKRSKDSVHEAGVRVPLIVTGPHVEGTGRVDEHLVHLADLLPTIADLTGVPLTGPDGQALALGDGRVALDGRSLMPLLAGEEQPAREFAYAEVFEPNGPGPYTRDHRGLRSRTHRLIRDGRSEHLFRVDGLEEGPDLLDGTPLAREDRVALDVLRARLDALTAELRWEGR